MNTAKTSSAALSARAFIAFACRHSELGTVGGAGGLGVELVKVFLEPRVVQAHRLQSCLPCSLGIAHLADPVPSKLAVYCTTAPVVWCCSARLAAYARHEDH